MLCSFFGGEMGLNKKKDLYVFGNDFLEYDNFTGKVADCLKEKVNVIKCSSPDLLLDSKSREILIMDILKDAPKPVIINDISRIKAGKILSLHDFDVGFFLNLMKRMGMDRKIKIIGIPDNGSAQKIALEVEKWI